MCGKLFTSKTGRVPWIKRLLSSFLQTTDALKLDVAEASYGHLCKTCTRLNDFHSRRWRVWQTEAKQETEVWRCVVAFVRIKTLDIFQQIWELSSRVCGYRSRSGQTWCFPKPNQNFSTEPSRKLNLNKCKVGTYSFKLSVVSAEMFLAIIYSDGWVVDQWFCGGPDSLLNVGPAH